MTGNTIGPKISALDKSQFSSDKPDSRYNRLIQFTIESLDDENGGVYAALEEILPRSAFYKNEYCDSINIDPDVISSINEICHRLKSESQSAKTEYTFDELVMIEIVAERVNQDINRDMIVERMTPNSKRAVTDRFSRYKFDLAVQGRESLSYSDRKLMEDFQNYEQLDNHGELIKLFNHSINAIDKKVFHTRVLATTFWRYFPYSFSSQIQQFSKVQQLYYLNALDPQYLLRFIEIYNESDLFPIAFCIYKLSFPNQSNRTIKEYCLDNTYVSTLASGISKIRHESKKTFKELTNNYNLSHSNLWHCGFLLSMVNDQCLDSTYADSLDFNSEMGLYSAQMLNQFAVDKKFYEDLSLNICKSFILRCEANDTSLPAYFFYTSFWEYIVDSIELSLNDDLNSYIQELERLSIDTQRRLFSWKPSSCVAPFTQLVYTILAWRDSLFHLQYKAEILPETTKLLNSKRLGKIFDFEKDVSKTFFANLFELLTSNEKTVDFQFPRLALKPIKLERCYNN